MSIQDTDKVWIASFDIGKKNFAWYIQEINLKDLSKIKNISSNKRFNKDGTPTESMGKILNKLYLNGKTILHMNSDLTKNCDKSKYLDPNTFHNMFDLLDKYIPYWDKCSVFVIEQQMNFGKRKNPMAMKLGQHCYSYFCFKYGRFKEVLEFPSYHKTQILGAPKVKGKKTKTGFRYKAMDKPKRKKWSTQKALEILQLRNEEENMNNIRTKAKKDDLADTLTQAIAFVYLRYIDKSI